MRTRGQSAPDAAGSVRRVSRSGDGVARLLSAVDHRQEEVPCPNVEVALDDIGVGGRGAHHSGARGSGDGLQLTEDGLQRVGRMLPIDEQPVETHGGAQFCGVTVGKSQPQPERRTPARTAIEPISAHDLRFRRECRTGKSLIRATRNRRGSYRRGGPAPDG